jgi:hypothetical protein
MSKSSGGTKNPHAPLGRGVSDIFKQHAIVFGLARVKFHRYGVPNALLWDILEAMATKDEDLVASWVSPLRYHNPPTTYARCLYLDL